MLKEGFLNLFSKNKPAEQPDRLNDQEEFFAGEHKERPQKDWDNDPRSSEKIFEENRLAPKLKLGDEFVMKKDITSSGRDFKTGEKFKVIGFKETLPDSPDFRILCVVVQKQGIPTEEIGYLNLGGTFLIEKIS